jgi:outer membrane protein OmpA-like peptidoglycan-associated protein
MGSTFKRVIFAAMACAALAGCQTVQNVQQRLASSPCHDTQVTFYFESNSETLTAAGDQIVSLTARRLQGCKVKELSLVGLADPTGSPEVNLTLSKHRADNVLEAFVRAGLPVPKYTLVASGDKGAVAASGAVVPVRRQVDATVVIAH